MPDCPALAVRPTLCKKSTAQAANSAYKSSEQKDKDPTEAATVQKINTSRNFCNDVKIQLHCIDTERG